ncbi:MAG TPA: preprotein translocase subunit SecA, partial [Xanthomonadales bacterium]|nr:preprotein translocase subunit SecA [Xanthomonadales bacterium]
ARQVVEAGRGLFERREAELGANDMRAIERFVMLQVLDQTWKEHLARMDYLRQGIHLRGYAQKQPKQEYKREAFELFSQMLDKVKHDAIVLLARIRIRSEQEVAAMEAAEAERQAQRQRAMQFQHPETGGLGADEEAAEVEALSGRSDPVVRDLPKVGRNDACPCGSGKKYKHCHGRLDS